MERYEYKVVSAPQRSKKVKGVRAPDELFALTLSEAINAEARGGWEYVRSETLSTVVPRGWFRRDREVEVCVLIFRRAHAEPHLSHAPEPKPGYETPPLSAVGREPHQREVTTDENGSGSEPASSRSGAAPADRIQAARRARAEQAASEPRDTEQETSTATNTVPEIETFRSPLRPAAPRLGPAEKT